MTPSDKEDKPPKELYCHFCREKVTFIWQGTEQEMDRYECPNMLRPGERHGIYIPLTPVAEEDSFQRYVERSSSESAEEPPVSRVAATQPRSGLRLPGVIRRTLETIGVSYVLHRIFSKEKPHGQETEHGKIEVEKLPDYQADIDDIRADIEDLPGPDMDTDPDALDDLLDNLT